MFPDQSHFFWWINSHFAAWSSIWLNPVSIFTEGCSPTVSSPVWLKCIQSSWILVQFIEVSIIHDDGFLNAISVMTNSTSINCVMAIISWGRHEASRHNHFCCVMFTSQCVNFGRFEYNLTSVVLEHSLSAILKSYYCIWRKFMQLWPRICQFSERIWLLQRRWIAEPRVSYYHFVNSVCDVHWLPVGQYSATHDVLSVSFCFDLLIDIASLAQTLSKIAIVVFSMITMLRETGRRGTVCQ